MPSTRTISLLCVFILLVLTKIEYSCPRKTPTVTKMAYKACGFWRHQKSQEWRNRLENCFRDSSISSSRNNSRFSQRPRLRSRHRAPNKCYGSMVFRVCRLPYDGSSCTFSRLSYVILQSRRRATSFRPFLSASRGPHIRTMHSVHQKYTETASIRKTNSKGRTWTSMAIRLSIIGSICYTRTFPSEWFSGPTFPAFWRILRDVDIKQHFDSSAHSQCRQAKAAIFTTNKIWSTRT